MLIDKEILSKLKSSILFYSKKLFSQNDLEKRINISYNDENKNIETYLSFAIEMSEKFKKKRTIANRLNIFKEVRKEVMQSAVHNNNKKALRDIFQTIKISNQSKSLFGNLALEIKKMKEQEKSNSQESQNNNTSPNNSSPNQENNEFILSKISHQRGRDAYYIYANKAYKYCIGEYATREEAAADLPKIRKQFSGAFIIFAEK